MSDQKSSGKRPTKKSQQEEKKDKIYTYFNLIIQFYWKLVFLHSRAAVKWFWKVYNYQGQFQYMMHVKLQRIYNNFISIFSSVPSRTHTRELDASENDVTHDAYIQHSLHFQNCMDVRSSTCLQRTRSDERWNGLLPHPHPKCPRVTVGLTQDKRAGSHRQTARRVESYKAVAPSSSLPNGDRAGAPLFDQPQSRVGASVSGE